MKTIRYHSQWEVMFDWRGITNVPSGTAPYHPNEVRIVIQNTEITRPTPAEAEAVRLAAEQGEPALRAWITANVKAGDARAADALADALTQGEPT